MKLKALIRRVNDSCSVVLWTTPIQEPAADDPRRLRWRTVLRLSPLWLGWEPEVSYDGKPFSVYNSASGWGIGFMGSWIWPEYRAIPYDGVALCCICVGFFRINWSRWATEEDYENDC